MLNNFSNLERFDEQDNELNNENSHRESNEYVAPQLETSNFKPLDIDSNEKKTMEEINTNSNDKMNDYEKQSLEIDLTGIEKKPEYTVDARYSWLVAFSGFLVQLIVLGVLNNVGSLNNYWIKEFNSTQGLVAWAGSLNIGVTFFSGPVVSLFTEKTSCQVVGMVGSLICFAGYILSTLSVNFPMLLVIYGLIFGFGASCCFFSSLLIQAKYFNKKLSMASGIVTAGSGVGTLILAYFTNYLYAQVGWRYGMRYLSFVLLLPFFFSMIFKDSKVFLKCSRSTSYSCCCSKKSRYHILNEYDSTASNQVVQPTLKEAKSKSNKSFNCLLLIQELCQLHLLRNIPFLLYTIGCFFFMLGYFVPYIHLISFAINSGIDSSHAAMLIGFMAISSLVGKILIGKLAEHPKISVLLIIQIAFLNIGIADLLAIFCAKYWHFIVYAVYFGMCDGAYVCLAPMCVGSLVGKEKIGPGVGLLFAIKAIPITVGAPIAGSLYDRTASYAVPFATAGGFSIVSFIFLLISFIVKRRQTNQYTLLEINENNDEYFEATVDTKQYQ